MIIFVASMMIISSSCTDGENAQNSENSNRMIEMSSDGNKGMQYLFSFQVGHLSSDCKNSCITIGGVTMHKNCMGYGHVCNRTAAVSLQQIGAAIVATTTDTVGLTNEDFFNMPARSLSTGEGGSTAYLNIPAQLVERDTATLQFTFTGLFYTDKPGYNNF